MFASMADFIHKHSKAVIVLWLVVLVCSLPLGLKAGDVLEYDITNMSGADTEASEGQALLDENFSNSVDLSEILVISYSSPAELKEAKKVSEEFSKLVTEKYGSTVSATYYGEYSKDDASVSGVAMTAIANNEEGYDIVHQTGNIRDLVDQAKDKAAAVLGSSYVGLTSYVTGSAAITYDTEKSSMEDVSKVDPISVLLIFVLLALFFYAVVTAFVPPAVVGMAYGITLTLIWAVGQLLGIYYITQTLLLVVMLGAGCDYSIFIVSRYRDERKKGMDHEHALKEAIMWGGESVATSGISVMIGFAALTLCSFSLVQTMGIILALGILVALLAALTFIPSLLNLAGEKLFWPCNIDAYMRADRAAAGEGRKGIHGHLVSFGKRYFGWLSGFTHKYAKAVAVAFIVVCVPATYVYATGEDSTDMISVMPDSESVDGLNLIMTQTDGGTIMPTYVVMELNDTAVAAQGEFPYTVGGNTINIPYVIWNDFGLKTIYTSGILTGSEGAVKDSMMISNSIKSEYDIVGIANGLTSWELLYWQAFKTIMETKGITPTNEMVNKAVYDEMPSAVQSAVAMVLNVASGLPPTGTGHDSWTCTPVSPLSPQIKVANVIDGILNIGTGILSDDGREASMMIITEDKPMSKDTMDFLDDLRGYLHDGDGCVDKIYSGTIGATYVTGSSASMNDIGDVVEEQFSFIRAVVIVLLILLLFFILGCYVTPIRAIITIVMSVIWTVALTRFVFTDLMGTPVLFLIPVVLFVVLLGLGMDYEIFLTTKIRENKIKGMDNDTAIDEAVKQAGGVISLCALLMGGTFLSLLLAGSSMLQEFGFALGVGILIDGLLMVGFVSPSLMHILGDWSWKGPAFLQRKHQE